jgi:Chaperonin 10 Kd subunit
MVLEGVRGVLHELLRSAPCRPWEARIRAHSLLRKVCARLATYRLGGPRRPDVVVRKYSGTEVKLDGEEHRIVDAEDILGVVEEG